jgi:cytoplasmic iron level regulating protein YaaA (DUF328/UPF0246 family)
MAERTLILVPCCLRKKPDDTGDTGDTPDYDRRFCITNYLSKDKAKKLMELRRLVARNLEAGPDIGSETLQATQVRYMRAYERYRGQLYSKISRESWEKLNGHSDLSLIIVSALYGILRHDEFIRNYDRKMTDKIEGRQLKTWWKNKGLCDILLDYVKRNKIEVVHDFLSEDYSEAIKPFQSKIKELGLRYEYHKLSEFGSGSNYYRGEEVNELIQTFPS